MILVCILCIFPSVWWVADHADRSYTFLFKPWPLDHNSSTEEICMAPGGCSNWWDKSELCNQCLRCCVVAVPSIVVTGTRTETDWMATFETAENSRIFKETLHSSKSLVCRRCMSDVCSMTNSMNFIIISDGPRWDMPQLDLRRDVRSFAMPKSMPWATSVQLLLTMEKAQRTPKKMAGFPSVFWSDNGEIGGVGPGNCQQISADHGWE